MHVLSNNVRYLRFGVMALIICSWLFSLPMVALADEQDWTPEFEVAGCECDDLGWVTVDGYARSGIHDGFEWLGRKFDSRVVELRCGYAKKAEYEPRLLLNVMYSADSDTIQEMFDHYVGVQNEKLTASGECDSLEDGTFDGPGYWYFCTTKEGVEKPGDRVRYQMGRAVIHDGNYLITASGWGYPINYGKPEEFIHEIEILQRHGRDIVGSTIGSSDLTVELSFVPDRPSVFEPLHFVADVPYPNCLGECDYEWFVNEEPVETGVGSNSHEFDWERPEDGSHTVSVKVMDETGKTAENSISVVVRAPWAYLEAVSGRVLQNGERLEVGDRYEVSGSYPLDTVETRSAIPPGYAILKYADGTILKINEGSEVIPKHGSVEVKKGSVWYYSENDDRPFSIITPSAVISPRGTEFEVEVEKDGTTIVSVLDGVADITDINDEKVVSVNPGEMSKCDSDGVPTYPDTFDVEAIDRWWDRFDVDPDAETGSSDGDDSESGFHALMIIVPIVVIVLVAIVVFLVIKRKRRNGGDKVQPVTTGAGAGPQCPKCGVQSEPGATFCRSCGYPFS